MAVTAADIGTGASISYGASAVNVNAFELLSIAYRGSARGVTDTSHMGNTKWRQKVPNDLRDPGSIECEINFDQKNEPEWESSGSGAVDAATLTVTFPDASTFAASAMLDEFEFDLPLEDKMTGRMTFMLLGEPTWVASS